MVSPKRFPLCFAKWNDDVIRRGSTQLVRHSCHFGSAIWDFWINPFKTVEIDPILKQYRMLKLHTNLKAITTS